MSEFFQDILAGLADIVGANHVIDSGGDQEPYVVDWRGRYRGRAVAVVKPGSTAEVAARRPLLCRKAAGDRPAGRQHRHVRRRHSG